MPVLSIYPDYEYLEIRAKLVKILELNNFIRLSMVCLYVKNRTKDRVVERQTIINVNLPHRPAITLLSISLEKLNHVYTKTST